MLLYHYANEPYTALKTKLAQGVMTPAMIAEEDSYATYRNDAFPSYKAISLLPDPIPLESGNIIICRNSRNTINGL